MKRPGLYLITCVLAALSFTSAYAACSDGMASRTIETVSFAKPYTYATATPINSAYTAWYSQELRLREDAQLPAPISETMVFDFMPDSQVVSLIGGNDCSWAAQAAGYSTITGSVTIQGSAAVSVSNIVIK